MLSVDHPLNINFKTDKAFIKFREDCNKTGTTEEALANADKLGFKTDMLIKHPFMNKFLPVYFANFVLMDYEQVLFLDALHMIKEILILPKSII